LFVGKTVHEIGSGCGLSGLTASLFAHSLTLSDYKQEILDNLKYNAFLNKDAKCVADLSGNAKTAFEWSDSVTTTKRRHSSNNNGTARNGASLSNDVDIVGTNDSLTHTEERHAAAAAPQVQVQMLDFEAVVNNPHTLTDNDRVDIVLGADICYGVHLAHWVPVVVDRLLNSNGVFYFCNPKNRFVSISISSSSSVSYFLYVLL
jgi:predicted nicotinamide N-methyase